ncbi:MAG: alpha-hydroxy-acid oxidizing protein, partial [Candidatus Rariloculaceae bacterium]
MKYLAASPALTPASRAFAQFVSSGDESLIEAVSDAFSVFDFEPFTRANLTDAHYTYMAMGVDNGATLQANREGFERLQIRPRRLIDVSNIDMSIDLVGTRHS